MSWSWTNLKTQWVAFLVDNFADDKGNALSDLWDIALPIVEDITHMDINNDGVVDHMKEEILAIVLDKGIEWGDEITEALIIAAKGNMLKQLFAAAQIASWAAQLTIFSNIPMSGWIINLVIEWIIKGIKSGLDIADNKFNVLIEEREAQFQAAVTQLIMDLETATGKDISTEHFWGTDKLTIFVGVDPVETLYASLRSLMMVQEDEQKYADYLAHWVGKIG